jgi:predicted enzyme related to lactoylglutathione lyase
MSNRVVHFEIPSDNPEKCAGFFTEVFGWKFQQFGDRPYLLATTGDENEPGINGAIMQKVGQGQPIINTISVDNIDETMVHIENAGGKIVKPKRAIPTIG